MPDFLEKKLRQEYGDNDRAIYGTMNNIGAMHGNKITQRGRQMEAKHSAEAGRKHIKPMQYGGEIPGDPNMPDDEEIRRRELQKVLGMSPSNYGGQPSPFSPPPTPVMPPPPPEASPVPPPDPYADMGKMVNAGQPEDSAPPEDPMQRMVNAGQPDQPPEEERNAPMNTEAPSPPPPAKIGPPEPPPQTLARTTSTAMGPLRNQEQATQEAMDYAQKMVQKTDKAGRPMTGPDGRPMYKQPSTLSNILQAAMQISPRTRGIDLHPNLTRQYQNLDILAKRANEERQAQVAQSTEEYHRAMAGAAMARTERDTAKARNPTQWGLLQEAANSPDPTIAQRAAKTLKLKEDSDLRMAGGKAGASATGRLDATRNAPAYTIKPESPEWRVAQDLAYGKIDFQDLQRLYSYNRDSGLKVALYNKAREFNPDFSPKDFEAGYKMASNPKTVAQLSSLDNVIMGVPDLLDASDMASRTGVTVLNNIVNKGGYWIGGRHYSDFRAARTAFADELSGALGYGSATDMSREMGFDMTDPNMSPENFQSAVETVLVPFVQRKRLSITRTMGPYGNRVQAPAYTPHTAASAPAPSPASPVMAAPAATPTSQSQSQSPSADTSVIVNGVRFPNQASADKAMAAWNARKK